MPKLALTHTSLNSRPLLFNVQPNKPKRKKRFRDIVRCDTAMLYENAARVLKH